jgi:hypothetical protein
MLRQIAFITFSFVPAFFCQSCHQSTPKPSTLNTLNWLLGHWENSTAKGISIEHWEQLNDSAFLGKSYFISGKDTVSTEQIQLVQHGANLYYIPTVREQNDNLPVRFNVSFFSDSTLVCENRAHDFPQKIEYTLITQDSMVASISGLVDDSYEEVFFPMKRVH